MNLQCGGESLPAVAKFRIRLPAKEQGNLATAFVSLYNLRPVQPQRRYPWENS
jgi:hypothetical protein